jgi:tRNA (guanosine-2'-O-)-methyltransferase
MRRSTADVDPIARFRPVARAVRELDSDAIEARIAVLEPFATADRRERLLTNIGLRVGSVTLVLDAIHDPHNGAALVRTADAFGLHTIHALERTESFLAARSVARGSERWVDVIGHRSVDTLVGAVPPEDVLWIAAEAAGDLLPEDLGALRVPFALVIGSERDGIGDDLHRRCRHSVRVPMRGYAESLNVSVTTGILLHRAMEGRPGDLAPLERRRLYLRGLVQTLVRAHDLLDARGLRLPLHLDA